MRLLAHIDTNFHNFSFSLVTSLFHLHSHSFKNNKAFSRYLAQYYLSESDPSDIWNDLSINLPPTLLKNYGLLEIWGYNYGTAGYFPSAGSLESPYSILDIIYDPLLVYSTVICPGRRPLPLGDCPL